MATPIVIPKVGESISEAVVGEWKKPDGAFVRKDEELVVLETEKVNQTVYAPHDGIVRIQVHAGQTVRVGDAIGLLEAASAPAAGSSAASASAAASAATTPSKPAAAADSIRPAPKSVSAGLAPVVPGGSFGLGGPVPLVPANPVGGSVAAAVPVSAFDGEMTSKKIISPLATKEALALKINAQDVPGTGAHGRVTRADVIRYAALLKQQQQAKSSLLAPPPSPAPAAADAAPAAAQPDTRVVRREPMTMLRRRIAERLVSAQHTAAMLTTFNEVDMSSIMGLRKKYKEEFEKKHGTGLGFMSFFVAACCSALRAIPRVNSQIEIDASGKPVIATYQYVDMGIAVAAPKGLLVPVIRNAEKLSFADIEKAVKDLGTRARDDKITVDEMIGGTFTITNGGIFGSMLSTPILNAPQSAILGMHKIQDRPVAIDGKVEIRPMMYLALSYDHRIMDGAEAVKFLVHIKEHLEAPERLLLSL